MHVNISLKKLQRRTSIELVKKVISGLFADVRAAAKEYCKVCSISILQLFFSFGMLTCLIDG